MFVCCNYTQEWWLIFCNIDYPICSSIYFFMWVSNTIMTDQYGSIKIIDSLYVGNKNSEKLKQEDLYKIIYRICKPFLQDFCSQSDNPQDSLPNI